MIHPKPWSERVRVLPLRTYSGRVVYDRTARPFDRRAVFRVLASLFRWMETPDLVSLGREIMVVMLNDLYHTRGEYLDAARLGMEVVGDVLDWVPSRMRASEPMNDYVATQLIGIIAKISAITRT